MLKKKLLWEVVFFEDNSFFVWFSEDVGEIIEVLVGVSS